MFQAPNCPYVWHHLHLAVTRLFICRQVAQIQIHIGVVKSIIQQVVTVHGRHTLGLHLTNLCLSVHLNVHEYESILIFSKSVIVC